VARTRSSRWTTQGHRRDHGLERGFDAARPLLRDDQLVVVEVKVMQRIGEDGDAQSLRIVAENVFDLAAVRKRWRSGSRCRATATPTRAGSRRSWAVPRRGRAGDDPLRERPRRGRRRPSDDWRVNPIRR